MVWDHYTNVGPCCSSTCTFSHALAGANLNSILKSLQGFYLLSFQRRNTSNPKTPQGPSTPMRPPSSNALTPQSVGCCPTSSSNGNNQTPMTPGANSANQNPATPAFAPQSLPPCDSFDEALESILSSQDVSTENTEAPSLPFVADSSVKTDPVEDATGLQVSKYCFLEMFACLENEPKVTFFDICDGSTTHRLEFIWV